MSGVEKSLEKLETLLYWITGILLAVSMLVIFGQVLTRKFFSFTPSWSEELARFSSVYVTMLASAIAVRHGAHITISLFEDLFRGKMLKMYHLLSQLLVLAYFVILFSATFRIFGAVTKQISPGLSVSMAVPYAAILAGCVLSGFFGLEKVFKELRQRG